MMAWIAAAITWFSSFDAVLPDVYGTDLRVSTLWTRVKKQVLKKPF